MFIWTCRGKYIWNKIKRKICTPGCFFPTCDLTALLSDRQYNSDTDWPVLSVSCLNNLHKQLFPYSASQCYNLPRTKLHLPIPDIFYYQKQKSKSNIRTAAILLFIILYIWQPDNSSLFPTTYCRHLVAYYSVNMETSLEFSFPHYLLPQSCCIPFSKYGSLNKVPLFPTIYSRHLVAYHSVNMAGSLQLTFPHCLRPPSRCLPFSKYGSLTTVPLFPTT